MMRNALKTIQKIPWRKKSNSKVLSIVDLTRSHDRLCHSFPLASMGVLTSTFDWIGN